MTVKVNANGEIVEASHSRGWDGSEWRKDPLRLGFSEQYVEREVDSGTGATLTQLFSIVPAGEVWVVTAFSCYPLDGDHTASVHLSIYDGAVDFIFKRAPSLLQNTSLECPTPLVLEAGDRLRVVWINAANGDSFRSYANGRKILIAE